MKDFQMCYETRWKEKHVACFSGTNRRDLQNWIVILNNFLLFVILQNLIEKQSLYVAVHEAEVTSLIVNNDSALL